MIVNPANSELTIAAPTSRSVPAASPMCRGALLASFSSFAVMSKSRSILRSRSLRLT